MNNIVQLVANSQTCDEIPAQSLHAIPEASHVVLFDSFQHLLARSQALSHYGVLLFSLFTFLIDWHFFIFFLFFLPQNFVFGSDRISTKWYPTDRQILALLFAYC